MSYSIQRPPLSENFYLPAKDDLLNLKVGDTVKLIFTPETGTPERMWVNIREQNSSELWRGEIDNDPFGDELKNEISSGGIVEFHPLDIIQIFNEQTTS